jgi:transcription elongation factor Elf1
MNLGRNCPFCGTEEVNIRVVGKRSLDGTPAIVSCNGCGASTHEVYCDEHNYNNALRAWKEGTIYSTYIQRIKS